MKRLFIALTLVLCLHQMTPGKDAAANIGAGLICTGIAAWGWVEAKKDPTVFVNFTAIFFTVKATLHFIKAAM